MSDKMPVLTRSSVFKRFESIRLGSLLIFIISTVVFCTASPENIFGEPTIDTTIKSLAPTPSGIEYDPIHETVYITSERMGTVSVISAINNTVVGNPIIVGSNPQGIAYDSAHSRMYVTNFGSNSVSVIDTNTNTVVGNPIIVGSNPQGIAYDSAHSRMYVANSANHTISVIDTNTNTVVGNPIIVGSNPQGIAYDSAHSRMYVTNFGSNSVSVIDTNTNTVVGNPIIVGSNPQGIAYDSAHSRMYVTNFGSNSVSVIDTNTNTVIGGRIKISSPMGIEHDLLNNKVYVTSIRDETVSTIDTVRNVLVGEPIFTGGNPTGLSLDNKTGRIFSTNHANSTISVIRTTSLYTMITSVIDGNNETLPFNGHTKSDSVTFTFLSKGNYPTLAHTFECKLDNSLFSRCSNPISYERLETNHTHTFKVRAIDEIGNVESQSADFSWVVLSQTSTSNRGIEGKCLGGTTNNDVTDSIQSSNTFTNEHVTKQECFAGGLSEDIVNPLTGRTIGDTLLNNTFTSSLMPTVLPNDSMTPHEKSIVTDKIKEDLRTCSDDAQRILAPDVKPNFMKGDCRMITNIDVHEQQEDLTSLQIPNERMLGTQSENEINYLPSGNIPLALPH